MRPTPAELDVARALIARVKAADPSIKRVVSGSTSCWCAPQSDACRADELGGVPDMRLCARAMGKNISRPKQVTDWVARLEKLEQAPAAESDSGLLVQPAWIEKNVPDVCATNSLVRKILACLCQVHRLLAADRGWGCASSHREAEGRRIPGSSRWLLTSTRGIAHCERAAPSH
jgi:hypothetical protein